MSGPARETRLGAALVIVSAVSFGAMGVFAHMATTAGATPTSLLALRFAIATVVVGAAIAARGIRLPRRGTLVRLALMGGIGYVGESWCYFTALKTVPASMVALLLYLYPVYVTVVAVALLGERLTIVKAAALLAAMAGVAITLGPVRGGNAVGITLAIGSGAFYAAYILAGTRLARGVSAIGAAWVVMAAATVVLTGMAALEGFALPATIAGWGGVVLLALVSTVVGVGAFLAGLARIGPVSASTLSALEPAVAAVLAALFLGERFTAIQAGGGVLIVGAAVALSRPGPGLQPPEKGTR
jgi:drug/metabolite transporter (DMT)-like permease